MTEEERVKEEIANLIGKVLFFGREVSDEWIHSQKLDGMPFNKERADQILSIKGIRIESENQELPEIDTEDLQHLTYIAEEAQQDMLKAGFVKCLKRREA